MFPPRALLAIFFLYIYIYCRCVKSRETFIISENLVEKHIMVDARPVQEIPYEIIMSRFKAAQRTPNFGSRKRKFHSFLVTSNRTITRKDLERVSKNKPTNTEKIDVNSTDLKPKPVVVINLMITRNKTSELYKVTYCEFSNEATFELGGYVKEDRRRQNKEYYINHLSNAQLTSAEICHGFKSKRPARTCS